MKLTLEEKVRLLNGVGSWYTYDAGGKINRIMMTDGPHGLRKQEVDAINVNSSKVATCFPTASAVSSSWNMEIIKLMAETIAAEAKKEKVSIVLGCGTNIKRSPLCGRNFEYFSEDPLLAGSCAASYIKAVEDSGVGTSLKHFACNNQETQRQTSNSAVDERALFEIYLKPFEMAVKYGQPATIMGSYNRINDIYSCANEYLLNDILRKKWGFKGAVISDWGAAMDIVKCVKAGLDLEMPDSMGFNTGLLLDAVKNGRISEEEIDTAASRILNLIDKYYPDGEEHVVDYDVHNQIACRIAADSAVLLKHQGQYPLKKDQKILVIGEMAVNMRIQGGGSSHINTVKTPNTVEILKEMGFDVTYSKSVPTDISQYDKVIYFCGLTDVQESEGYDRASLNLPADQVTIIEELLSKSNKLINLVTFGGSPFVIPHLEKFGDILHMHLGGQAVGEACAKLLTGEIVPSGKLSETYPLAIEDTPAYGFWGRKSNNVNYVESIFVGYRYYETFDIPVEFEFGHGLSYTTFEYDNLHIKQADGKIIVSYDIINTGEYAAAEVSQIYVINPESDIMRPKKELKGFDKSFIEPGQRVHVEKIILEKDLCIYDKDARDFVTPEGNYKIAVGASCRKLYLETEVHVDGAKVSENQRTLYPEYFSGKFSLEGFLRYYGRELKDYDNKKPGDYTIYDSLQDVCSRFFVGKCILKGLYFAVRFITKAPVDDPAFLLTYNCMMEAPLTSMIAFSGGKVSPNMANWLVKKANKSN